MSAVKTTGLGEPELMGKKSLFQPLRRKPVVSKDNPKRVGETTPRLRITTLRAGFVIPFY